MVILCYPGAFAPSAPVPDPTSGVSGVFELEVQEPGMQLERQSGAGAAEAQRSSSATLTQLLLQHLQQHAIRILA